MLQYFLTGLAGIALGIVAMRVWQSREDAKDSTSETLPHSAGIGSRKLLIGSGAMVAAAIGLLVWQGTLGEEAPPPAAAPAGSNPQLADVDTMIAKLAARLETDRNDGEGFRMLGWSYLMTNRPQQALAPYRRAVELLPNQATVHSGYGEALVGVAAGKVTPEAKAAIDRALQLDPKEPRARYFAGLWLAQNDRAKEALDGWIELANTGPAEAPWQAEVQAKIRDEAAKQGIDVSGRLKVKAAAPASQAAPVGAVPPPDLAKAQAVQQLPPAQQAASVEAMVGGLAAKLKANPQDAKGWAMLVRSRMVLGQDRQAATDVATARKSLANDPAGLAEVNAAARAAGVPGS